MKIAKLRNANLQYREILKQVRIKRTIWAQRKCTLQRMMITVILTCQREALVKSHCKCKRVVNQEKCTDCSWLGINY